MLADNPYALKEVDKAEDFDVNRSVAGCVKAQVNLSFDVSSGRHDMPYPP